MGRALHFFVRQCGGVLVVLTALAMAGCGGGATSTGGGNNVAAMVVATPAAEPDHPTLR